MGTRPIASIAKSAPRPGHQGSASQSSLVLPTSSTPGFCVIGRRTCVLRATGAAMGVRETRYAADILCSRGALRRERVDFQGG